MSIVTNIPQKPEISQKEYLKKYLSKDKGEKKKKKVKISSSSHLKRSVIIDDDLGLPNVASVEDEEFNLDYLGDEAPQIAGIIDERPPEIKAKESHGDRNKWKPVGDPGGMDFLSNEHSISNGQSNNGSVVRTESDVSSLKGKSKYPGEGGTHYERDSRDSDSDLSPPRVKNKYEDKSKDSHKRRPLKNDDDSDLSPPRSKHRNSEKEYISKRNKAIYDSDTSPPRRSRYEEKSRRKGSDSDVSPPRKNKHDDRAKRKRIDCDLSPPRKNKYNDSIKRKGSDSDFSPPRKSKHVDRIKRRGSDSDLSPPRKNKHEDRKKRKGSDSDFSPPRKNKYENRAKKKENDSDLSPPRKNRYDDRAKRKGSDSDLSPPRKNKYENKAKRKENDSDLSPPRKNRYDDRAKRKGSDSDLSPPRKNKYENRAKRKENDSDLSPPRKNRYEDRTKRKGSDSDLSPPRKNRNQIKSRRAGSDSDLSPPRKNRNQEKTKRRGADSEFSSSKNNLERNDRRHHKDSSRAFHGKNNHMDDENRADKTLDGKKAGLQDAKNLKDELRKLKEQENALFEKMKASVSGKSAAVIKRDKKTGKIRDIDKEKEEEVKKSARVTERENKYARWGKGLKQIEEAEERVADYLHEVNKPLARYANDQDLDRMLKARDREGDPMLDYIRNKQSESIDVDNRGKPTYQGYYLPNRFNIRPGHRWDGVDRSNGYEKQWFEKQNAKKALQEEAYKWSTSDM
ncbi:unnamed protein product [Nezara viridula]|uniref:BUD13 homolog n=1 Tax=Nezara viridula TaxID=85310 RepID=A0A9P0EAQ1_NEZVI|nr:unnamed protein product [Nezara viridula]